MKRKTTRDADEDTHQDDPPGDTSSTTTCLARSPSNSQTCTVAPPPAPVARDGEAVVGARATDAADDVIARVLFPSSCTCIPARADTGTDAVDSDPDPSLLPPRLATAVPARTTHPELPLLRHRRARGSRHRTPLAVCALPKPIRAWRPSAPIHPWAIPIPIHMRHPVSLPRARRRGRRRSVVVAPPIAAALLRPRAPQ
jgi:hypothetical protein